MVLIEHYLRVHVTQIGATRISFGPKMIILANMVMQYIKIIKILDFFWLLLFGAEGLQNGPKLVYLANIVMKYIKIHET